MANDENLRRGNMGKASANFANAEGAARASAAAKVQRENDEVFRSEADPDDVILAMLREAGLAATKGLKKFNRKGGEPSRQVIEATKEARQLATVAADILRARGAATEAERFFAEVASRISAANLGEGPQPIGEVSLA